MAKKLSDYDRGMIIGIAIACSTIQSAYDDPQACAEAIAAAGLNREKMKRAGVERYDLDILRPAFAELNRSKRWERRKLAHARSVEL